VRRDDDAAGDERLVYLALPNALVQTNGALKERLKSALALLLWTASLRTELYSNNSNNSNNHQAYGGQKKMLGPRECAIRRQQNEPPRLVLALRHLSTLISAQELSDSAGCSLQVP
jgi:hypothetical protein